MTDEPKATWRQIHAGYKVTEDVIQVGSVQDLFKKAVAEEKRNLKRRLRKAIAERDIKFIYYFCCGAHPAYVRSQTDLLLYGASVNYIDEAYVLWVDRYFRRLTGETLIGKRMV